MITNIHSLITITNIPFLHIALFLSQCKGLERAEECAQGTMGIAKWRSEVFSFFPSSSTRSFSVMYFFFNEDKIVAVVIAI